MSPLVNPTGTTSPAQLRRAVGGKVVLVTGASHGIGEAAARELGAAGAIVVLAAPSVDRLAAVAEQIRVAGGTAHPHGVDLCDGAAVERLAAEVVDRHGAVDVVVSNAGKSIRRSVALSYDRFHDVERTLGVNYTGPVRLLLALLPSMRARGTGHIVNVSTVGVRLPPVPRWGPYVASKTAFDVWLRSAAPELRTDGVAVTTIYMALVHTRMSAPTPMNRYLPGLSAAQAGHLVARAVVDRPGARSHRGGSNRCARSTRPRARSSSRRCLRRIRAQLLGPVLHAELSRGELLAELRVVAQKRFVPPVADTSRTYSVPTLLRWRRAHLSLRPKASSIRGCL